MINNVKGCGQIKHYQHHSFLFVNAAKDIIWNFEEGLETGPSFLKISFSHKRIPLSLESHGLSQCDIPVDSEVFSMAGQVLWSGG